MPDKPTRCRLFGSGWVAVAVVAALAVRAQADTLVGVEDWGLGGSVKAGLWSPLYLEVMSTGEDFTGFLEVEVRGAGRLRPIFTKPVTLPKDTPTQHWLYLRPPVSTWRRGHGQAFYWAMRNDKGRVVLRRRWQRPAVLPAGDSVVAVFRVPGVGASGLSSLLETDSAVRTNVVLLTPGTAPDRSIGYQGADALVWLNPEPAQMTTVAQREAVLNYVRQGGHLVLAAGAAWPALTGSFLSEVLPARPTGSGPVRGLAALAPYGLAPASTEGVVLARLEEVRGVVLLEEGGRPVVVRGWAGAGRVTLIGFDPTRSPFAEMAAADKRRFWTTALDLKVISRPARALGTMEQASGLLVRPLNDFPGFKPINFTFIAVFLVVYIVLIGPADYFILKRLKRLHWTWVTFPSVAVLASVLAFWLLSAERIRGLLANSISVVDASAEAEEISGTTLMTFLSPRRTRYTVTLAPEVVGALAPREFRVLPAAQGLGLGGTTCRVYGAGEVIDELLVRVWDAQTVEARWRASAPELPQVELSVEAGFLQGTITNSTPDTLYDVVVLFAGPPEPQETEPGGAGRLQAIDLGTLAPGSQVSVDNRPGRPVAEYARSLGPFGRGRGRSRHRGSHPYHGWGAEPRREEADPAARWVSLLTMASEERRFRRWVTSEGEVRPGAAPREPDTSAEREAARSVVFDLSAGLQLPAPSGPTEATVLYSVDRSFAPIYLSGRRPTSWDRTLVRLRVRCETQEEQPPGSTSAPSPTGRTRDRPGDEP